jgi:hypothetical protein
MKSIVGQMSNTIGGVTANVKPKSSRHSVIRKDHHVSEPVKMMRQIAENDNSPLIPESLQVNGLQSADHSKILAKQNKNKKPSEASRKIVTTPKDGKQSRKNGLVTKMIQNGFIIIACSLFIFLIVIILGIVAVKTKFYSTGI